MALGEELLLCLRCWLLRKAAGQTGKEPSLQRQAGLSLNPAPSLPSLLLGLCSLKSLILDFSHLPFEDNNEVIIFRLPGFAFQLYHLLALWHRANPLASLGCFLIDGREIVMLPTLSSIVVAESSEWVIYEAGWEQSPAPDKLNKHWL